MARHGACIQDDRDFGTMGCPGQTISSVGCSVENLSDLVLRLDG
jgi:hypothetical protein